MRKTILTMLLAVVSSSAAAEWVEVYPYEERWINYVDPATISKAGDIVTMLSLGDRKERPTDKYGSVKFLIEYDCKKKQYRVLDTSCHSGNMGGGTENHEKNVRPYWKGLDRGGIFEAQCGRVWEGPTIGPEGAEAVTRCVVSASSGITGFRP